MRMQSWRIEEWKAEKIQNVKKSSVLLDAAFSYTFTKQNKSFWNINALNIAVANNLWYLE